MGDALGEGLLAAAPGVQRYGEGLGAAQERAQRASEATRAHDLSQTLGMGQLGIRRRLAAIEEGMGPARIAKMEAESEEAKARAKVAVESLPYDLAASAAAAGIQTENLAFLVGARSTRLKALQADLTGKETANEFAAKMMDPKYEMLLQEIEAGGVSLEQLKNFGPARLKQLGAETSRIEEQTASAKQTRIFQQKLQPIQLEKLKIENRIAKLEEAAKVYGVSPEILRLTTENLRADVAMRTEQVTELQEKIKLARAVAKQTEQAPFEVLFNATKDALQEVAVSDEQARAWVENNLMLPAFAVELQDSQRREAMVAELAQGYMVPLYEQQDGSLGRAPRYSNAAPVSGTGLGREEAIELATSQIEQFTRDSTNLAKFTMDHFAETGDSGPGETASVIYRDAVEKSLAAKGNGDMKGAIEILQDGLKKANEAARDVSPKRAMQRLLKKEYTHSAVLVRELDALIDAAGKVNFEDDKPLLREKLRFWGKRLDKAFADGDITEQVYRRETERANRSRLGGLRWRDPLFLKPQK